MVGGLVGVDDPILAMKKTAVQRGFEEQELQDYLGKYAFRNGTGGSLRVRASVSTPDYMFTKRDS
jgi:hypothetical protein